MPRTNIEYFKTYRPKISDDLVPSSAKDIALVEQKQRKIVEGACKLFFEKGFHGTNMREIAAASGMSIGQLYHYISTKDDILFLVAKHMQELWYDYLLEFGFQETEDPLIRLVRALRSSIQFPARNKKLLQFIYSESKYLDREHLDVILKMDDKNVTGFYRKLLEEVHGQYPLECDLDLAARLITFATVFIALRGWHLKKWPEDQTVDFVVNFILKGLGLPPAVDKAKTSARGR